MVDCITLLAKFSEEAARLVNLSLRSCKSSILSLWLDSLLFLALVTCILGDFGDLGWKYKLIQWKIWNNTQNKFKTGKFSNSDKD